MHATHMQDLNEILASTRWNRVSLKTTMVSKLWMTCALDCFVPKRPRYHAKKSFSTQASVRYTRKQQSRGFYCMARTERPQQQPPPGNTCGGLYHETSIFTPHSQSIPLACISTMIAHSRPKLQKKKSTTKGHATQTRIKTDTKNTIYSRVEHTMHAPVDSAEANAGHDMTYLQIHNALLYRNLHPTPTKLRHRQDQKTCSVSNCPLALAAFAAHPHPGQKLPML